MRDFLPQLSYSVNHTDHGNRSQVYFSFRWIGVIAVVADGSPHNVENSVPFQSGSLFTISLYSVLLVTAVLVHALLSVTW